MVSNSTLLKQRAGSQGTDAAYMGRREVGEPFGALLEPVETGVAVKRSIAPVERLDGADLPAGCPLATDLFAERKRARTIGCKNSLGEHRAESPGAAQRR